MKIFLAVVFFLIGTTGLYAQCGRRVIVNQPYVAPVIHDVVAVKEVITPIAIPILIPAFQFQYAPPAVPCAAVGVGPPVVGAPPMPGYMPGYGAAPPPSTVSPVNSRDKIKELAKALLEEMNKQADAAAPEDDGPPVVPGVGSGKPPGLPPGGPPINRLTREQAAPIALSAMSRVCAQCHTGSGSKGDTALFVQPGVINNESPWDLIEEDVRKGRMPPKNSQFRLTNEEKTAMRVWLSQGS